MHVFCLIVRGARSGLHFGKSHPAGALRAWASVLPRRGIVRSEARSLLGRRLGLRTQLVIGSAVLSSGTALHSGIKRNVELGNERIQLLGYVSDISIIG